MPATAGPSAGQSNSSASAKIRALQQRARNLRHFDEPLRDVDQPALGVGLPKPVAGVFLKFLQQQRDRLGLTRELQLRLQIVEEQPAIQDHVAGDEDRVDQQEDRRHGVGVDLAKQQRHRGRRGHRPGVGQPGAGHRGERETACRDHSRHEACDDQLMGRPDRGQDHDRHRSPGQRQDQGLDRQSPYGVARCFFRWAAARPYPRPRRQAPPQRRLSAPR